MPGRAPECVLRFAGGGKYMAVLQFKKLSPSDEGRQRQAALLAFSAFSELKHVFLVDEDVDCFDMNDVIWAMNTRFQGDADIITIPRRAVPSARSVERSDVFTVDPRSRDCMQDDFRLYGAVRSKRTVCAGEIYGSRSEALAG